MTIATRSIQIFTTSDGKDFADVLDATRHQAQVDATDAISAFIASRDLDKAAATRTSNLIRDWVAFTAQAPADAQAA